MTSSTPAPLAHPAGPRQGRQPYCHHLQALLRNAVLPVITVAGDLAASLVKGTVVVETIYGWPGIGKLMIDAIIQRDFAVVQSTILVTACAIFILNIAIDLACALLDPRIRRQAT